MPRRIHSITLALCISALTAIAPALDPLPTSPDDFPTRMPALIQRLASPEYDQRVAAQKDLDLIPASHVESLRDLAKSQPDPEVKARLDERIDAMELYNLLHPPGLSLNVKDASLSEIANLLNAQLGATMLQGAGTGTYSLNADHQPFWEIVTQLNRQKPLNMFTSTLITGAGTNSLLRLTSLPGTLPLNLKIVDAFAIRPTISNTATGTSVIRLTVTNDPRVRVIHYTTSLQIDKLIDQNGKSLLPQLLSTTSSIATPVRPATGWISSASFTQVPGLTRIRLLHGKMSVGVLEREKVLSFELEHLPEKPVETRRGNITVERSGNDALMLRIVPPPGSTNAPVAPTTASFPTTITLSDGAGKSTTIMSTGPAAMTQSLTPYLRNLQPKTLTLSWPEAFREVDVPVEFNDLDVAAPEQP